MRLAKIKNRYLYNSDNPEGIHTYAVYQDKRTREMRAVPLTHLYVRDENRFNHVRRGNIRVEKFKEFTLPSGVRNYYFSRTVDGKKINLKDSEVVNVGRRYLPKAQSNRIRNFAEKKNSHR